MQRKPWGVHSIRDIYAANVSAGMPDGSYVRAVAEPYTTNRLQAAWWVLTGRAYAMLWPDHGDLEQALGINVRRRSQDASGEDRAETISENPKSWAAWKREADSWRRVAERLEREKQASKASGGAS